MLSDGTWVAQAWAKWVQPALNWVHQIRYDHLEHFTGSMILVWMLATVHLQPNLAFSITILVGGMYEWAQYQWPSLGHAEWSDFYADSAGAALATVFLLLV